MADIRDSIRRRIVRIADPAAGAELSVTVPGQETWVVESVRFQLVTDATVQLRQVRLTATDGTVEYFRTLHADDHPQSITAVHSAFNGSSPGGDDTKGLLLAWPTHGLVLPPGHVLATSTLNIAAGDQFSAARLAVLAIPTGPRARVEPAVDVLLEPLGLGVEIDTPYVGT